MNSARGTATEAANLSLGWWRSLHGRIVSLLAIYLGIALAAFAVLSTRFFTVTHQGAFDSTLFNLANDFIQRMRREPEGEIRSLVWIDDVLHRSLPFGKSRIAYVVQDETGKLLFDSGGIRTSTLTDNSGWRRSGLAEFKTVSSLQIWLRAEAAEEPYRLVRTTYEQAPGEVRLLTIGAPMSSITHWSQQIYAVTGVAIVVAVIVAVVAGRAFTRKALEPVREIVEAARRIAPGELSARVPVPSTDDELRVLAVTLNGMLTRIENAFLAQDRFVADASHQLKTPVAVMKNEIATLRAQASNPAAVASFIESSEQEIDQLESIVSDLLLLAQIESGSAQWPATMPFDLDELVTLCVRQIEGLARKAGIKIKVSIDYVPHENEDDSGDGHDEPFALNGHVNLLQSAIQNLLSNALKYCNEGGTVSISLISRSAVLTLDVRDDGPGVPEGREESIFERFYRGDENSGKHVGSGLGLSIARRIVEMHGGTLNFVHQGPGQRGALFRLELPQVGKHEA